ncbi:MAG: dihydrodipicolinate synthase family protein [Bryobacterales bacterium]|nr:dihydrodipicolinate synthase family protein [Bryobacterales bacterium]
MPSLLPNQIHGPIAALLTPRTSSGLIDRDALEANARFVLSCGARGLCLSGATGEYSMATEQERVEAVEWIRAIVPQDRLLLAGVGAPDTQSAIRLAGRFQAAGADLLLVPTPHFFPYPPAEIEEFYRVFAAATPLPVLIYNLPQFTSGVPLSVVSRLIETVPNIVGIKDSSGETATLRALTERPELAARRIIGNDNVFRAVLTGGLVDGCISGVAGVLPELTVACLQSASDPALALLEELIPHLGPFPTPWGLKLIAEGRGFFPARHAMPVSPGMQDEMRQFLDWFSNWWTVALPALAASSQSTLAGR